MANYKVAYGRKENMSLAIEKGIIPPGCIILTEDSAEIFFYDLTRNLKIYKGKTEFDSKEEAEDWISQYNCKGQLLSIQEQGICNVYVVEYDNTLSKVGDADYIVDTKNPTSVDSNYKVLTHWINANTDNVFLLISVREDIANWKKINIGDESRDLSYRHNQSSSEDTWLITHNLKKYPSVTIVDSSGNVVVGEVNYINSNSLTVKFNGAFSGKAYLN